MCAVGHLITFFIRAPSAPQTRAKRKAIKFVSATRTTRGTANGSSTD